MTDNPDISSAPAPSTEPVKRTALFVWLIILGVVPMAMQAIGWPRYHIAGSAIGASIDFLTIGTAVLQAGLLAFGRYAILGLILARWARRSPGSFFAAICLGIGLVAAFESGDALLASQNPALVAFVLGWIGVATGLAVGIPWGAGKRGRSLSWLLIALGLIAPIVIGGIYANASVVTAAPVVQMPKVTSLEKRRLIELVRKQREIDPATPDIATISFSWHDLRLFAAWGCEVVAPKAKATVTRTDQGAHGVVALPLPGGRFASFEGTLAVEGDDRGLRLDWHDLRFGERELPAWVASLSNPVAIRLAQQDAIGRHVLMALHDLRMDAEGVAMTYDKIVMPDEYLGHVTGAIDDPTLIDATRFYIKLVMGITDSLPRGDQRLTAIFAHVFGAARDRSIEGDPVVENKAAVLALAVTLGHREIAKFIGPVIDDTQRERIATAPKATIQRRVDWVQHFTLSAGLAVLSSEGVSDAIGLLKEELDGRAKGSGFSFTDLAADRAGTRFGTVATRTKEDATRIQNMLAGGFDAAILLPPIADLPEGLHDTEFGRRFGKVGSPTYKALMEDIEARLDALPALN